MNTLTTLIQDKIWGRLPFCILEGSDGDTANQIFKRRLREYREEFNYLWDEYNTKLRKVGPWIDQRRTFIG